MLRRLTFSDWLLGPALVAFLLFWGFALTGSLPALPNQKHQPISNSSAECTTHECWQEANEKALTDYTGMLAWFTAVLAIVSSVQGIFLWRADRAARRAAEASTAATKASQELSNKQFLLEGTRADLATKQHGLLRLQHIAANKPLLRIRGIALAPIGASGSLFEKGEKVRGSLVVANSGATEAKIIDSGYRFFWSSDGLPMRPPLDAADVSGLLLTDDPIVGYGSRGVQIESRYPLPIDGSAIRNGSLLGNKLYIMGFIHYADIKAAERFMGFCRCYLPPDGGNSGSQGRFIPVDNADYEYSD